MMKMIFLTQHYGWILIKHKSNLIILLLMYIRASNIIAIFILTYLSCEYKKKLI